MALGFLLPTQQVSPAPLNGWFFYIALRARQEATGNRQQATGNVDLTPHLPTPRTLPTLPTPDSRFPIPDSLTTLLQKFLNYVIILVFYVIIKLPQTLNVKREEPA
ncbi:hypothetical protein [Moorena sp. SIO3I8]|uniref:hypothetical protein n=1 Tax=Moorena sp. SIO3I8 TaxID=2607833 RepID=UPI0013C183D9|nr:hypothetical protein [Moorena sp. SIO3I8]NEO04980.1 hypothetical protein [Moorena sp. SIO3I8]